MIYLFCNLWINQKLLNINSPWGGFPGLRRPLLRPRQGCEERPPHPLVSSSAEQKVVAPNASSAAGASSRAPEHVQVLASSVKKKNQLQS